MASQTLRNRLQTETMGVHQRLHGHAQFAAIAEGSIRADDFHRLMGRMGSFYAALDPLMSAACERVGLGTYRYRNRAPMFLVMQGDPPVLPKMENLSALVGTAYVVDGSVLGGQILRRAVAGRLHHPYWDWCAKEGASIWRDTRALIDFADGSPDANDLAVQTANTVFASFEDHMDMSREGVPV